MISALWRFIAGFVIGFVANILILAMLSVSYDEDDKRCPHCGRRL